ncbi:hypothetical protein CAPTEDRAFT_118237 [Capitella teleta]|uniref:Protein-lysine N-methyltransferase SMYD4 n=1 Tax=Capitella teleta TaxID=283909 RepID=R7T4C3_CAPTE|nr:hypothetical protein CAPTEDRAFT_118237 [Capitella teleta]|eukprot:ELT87827.1 hypothetical protein CAPTEDRAFT_118237 [Capitella teleta]
MFNKVTSKLKSESKIDGISKEFGALSSDQDRASYALSLAAVEEFIRPGPLVQLKSVEHSLSFKTTGNTAYRASEYRDAVQLYTDSIAWAPMLTDGGEDALSLAYGNRSAALYQLQQYEACIRDIDRALTEQYPPRLLHKVFHRKAMCRLNLEQFEAAEESFLQPNQPDSHDQYVSLSSACSVASTENEGRFITAVRNIAPGEIVLIEKPFASVLLRANYSNHCHHCLKHTLEGIPCRTCPDARFCSEACRDTAMQTYHQYECSVLNTLHHSQINKFGCLAFRAITKQSYQSLKDIRAQDLPLNGCHSDGLYRPQDYNTIIQLVTHAKDRPVQDLFHRTVMAVYLLKLLQQTSYFNGEEDVEMQAYIAGLFLSHLQSFPCNAHEVPELYLDPNAIDLSMPNELGAGIYSTLSLFNHSCDPGVNRNFYGDTCVVRAIKTIRKGHQVSDNYGALYATNTLKERHDKLQPQYFFSCRCEPCSNDWPLYQKINIDSPRYKCTQCQKEMTRDDITNCCSSNIEEIRAKFNKSEVEFRSAFEDLLACRVEEALPVFLRHLALIQEMIVLPWRQFNDCQEALKQCYSLMGNSNTSCALHNGNIF